MGTGAIQPDPGGPRRHPVPGASANTGPHHTRTLVDPGDTVMGDGHTTRSPRPAGLRLVRGESSTTADTRVNRDRRAALAKQVGAENRRAAAMTNSDARRIMAQRVAECLDGGRAGILVPERRRALISTAERLGLRRFDANLIIAIVQDRFRRGLLGASGAAMDDRLELITLESLDRESPDRIPHPALAQRKRERFWSAVRLFLAAVAISGILTVWLVNWLTGNLP